MHSKENHKERGFTIVELLIVIVVIAIIAAISVVAYRGIQARARDSIRSDGVAKIKKALEVYKTEVGHYPGATPNPGSGGFEASTDPAGTFMEYLNGYGFSNGAPVDPINNFSQDYLYWYIRHAAGAGGCPVSKGGFYVIWVRYENNSTRPQGNTMPSTCTAPDPWWSESGGTYYTFSSFEN